MLSRRTSTETFISALRSVNRWLSRAYKILWFEFGEEKSVVMDTFIKIMGTVLKKMCVSLSSTGILVPLPVKMFATST